MASDVTGKAEGPLWKLTKQGVRDLDKVKGAKQRAQRKVYKYWHMGTRSDGKWIACRIAWQDHNPPDYRGYYICALCGGSVHKNNLTLDHIFTRSSHPELKYEFSNLQPAHYSCNYRRGSMSMEAWNQKRKRL